LPLPLFLSLSLSGSRSLRSNFFCNQFSHCCTSEKTPPASFVIPTAF
jgi:hypothetical protein